MARPAWFLGPVPRYGMGSECAAGDHDEYAKEATGRRRGTPVGFCLDESVAVTGWSRDNARRQVARAGQRLTGHRVRYRSDVSAGQQGELRADERGSHTL